MATAQMMTNTHSTGLGLVIGDVMHRRLRPAQNRFTYPVWCLRLPLSQLSELPRLGVALNRRGLVSFQERDHGAHDGSSLQAWVRTLLKTEGIDAGGEIVLYTFPRTFGYVFNPVSFYVCHDRPEQGGRVRAVLCEVHNTFGEHHNYLLAHDDGRALASGESLSARKVFHVSPFIAVDGDYAFRFHFGAERWLARIDHGDAGGPLLQTCISGEVSALSRVGLRRALWGHRWLTVGVIARIHYQALRLWAKRVPFFRKPEPPLEETTR
jgi:hypothetical protein